MPTDPYEERSEALEAVRMSLRKHLDTCDAMLKRSHFSVTQDTSIILTPSEQKAITRHIRASHGHIFVVSFSFEPRRRQRKPPTTRIVADIVRKKQRGELP